MPLTNAMAYHSFLNRRKCFNPLVSSGMTAVAQKRSKPDYRSKCNCYVDTACKNNTLVGTSCLTLTPQTRKTCSTYPRQYHAIAVCGKTWTLTSSDTCRIVSKQCVSVHGSHTSRDFVSSTCEYTRNHARLFQKNIYVAVAKVVLAPHYCNRQDSLTNESCPYRWSTREVYGGLPIYGYERYVTQGTVHRVGRKRHLVVSGTSNVGWGTHCLCQENKNNAIAPSTMARLATDRDTHRATWFQTNRTSYNLSVQPPCADVTNRGETHRNQPIRTLRDKLVSKLWQYCVRVYFHIYIYIYL